MQQEEQPDINEKWNYLYFLSCIFIAVKGSFESTMKGRIGVSLASQGVTIYDMYDYHVQVTENFSLLHTRTH